MLRFVTLLGALLTLGQAAPWRPSFELVQPELFSAAGGHADAWADADGDGDPDLFIGFADPAIAAKVYRNDDRGTKFVNVAGDIGVNLKGVARQPAPDRIRTLRRKLTVKTTLVNRFQDYLNAPNSFCSQQIPLADEIGTRLAVIPAFRPYPGR